MMWYTTKKELIGVEPNENDPETYCCQENCYLGQQPSPTRTCEGFNCHSAFLLQLEDYEESETRNELFMELQHPFPIKEYYVRGHVDFDQAIQIVEANADLKALQLVAIRPEHVYGRWSCEINEDAERIRNLRTYTERGRGRFPITKVPVKSTVEKEKVWTNLFGECLEVAILAPFKDGRYYVETQIGNITSKGLQTQELLFETESELRKCYDMMETENEKT